MSKMPATLVCKLNISRQFKLKYTVITRSDICAPEPAQIHRKLLYLLEQTASISKLAVIVPNDTDRQKLSTKFLKLCLLTSTPNYQCVTNF
jgi:hypothetical protein